MRQFSRGDCSLAARSAVQNSLGNLLFLSQSLNVSLFGALYASNMTQRVASDGIAQVEVIARPCGWGACWTQINGRHSVFSAETDFQRLRTLLGWAGKSRRLPRVSTGIWNGL